MSISQIAEPQSYSRRLVGSLGIALLFHGLLLLIPIYRWLGHDAGESAGIGGGRLPFMGTLLGASVVIRAPETPDVADAVQEAESPPADAPDAEPIPTPSTESTDPFDESELAVELMPPAHAGSSGDTGTDASMESALSGSLQPLGGGGGIQMEMDLIPERSVYPAPLNQIVLKRKIEDDVIVQVLVDVDGYVLDHRVLRSIPRCPECTASAVEAALGHVFPPPTFEGEPVQAWVTMEFHFGTKQ
jgi:hypothetical protein